MANCINHADWVGEKCPECNEQVDDYGNTESSFRYCCFPERENEAMYREFPPALEHKPSEEQRAKASSLLANLRKGLTA